MKVSNILTTVNVLWITTLLIANVKGTVSFEEASLVGSIKWTTLITPSETAGPCDGFTHYSFQPHEDCTKFYVCPQEVVENCPMGTEFNPVHKYCQEAHLAGCSVATTPEISTTGPPEDTTTVSTPSVPSDPCADYPYYCFQPHEDCSKFYVCPQGVVNNCPSGLEFNPVYKFCQVAYLAGCTDTTTTEISNITTSTSPITTSTYTSTTTTPEDPEICTSTPSSSTVTTPNETSTTTTTTSTTTTTTTSGSLGPCDGAPANSQQPHEDCSKFYMCPSEKVGNCPNGMEFNPVAKYCQEAHLAGCNSTTTPDTSTTTTNTPPIAPGPCYGAPLNSHQPHEDCSKFYLCPSEAVESCPNGLEFNPVAQYCQEAHLAGCSDFTTPDISTTTTNTPPISPSPCYGAPLNSHQPHEDCSKFYLCPSETVESCPNGLEFNPVSQYCQEAHLAGCSDITTPDISTTTTNTPPIFDSPCYGAPLNSHQPHEDCSKFYLCPSETVESCPNGLEFNPVSQYCQEAHLAGCSNSTTPDISTTTTNTPPIFDSPCYGAPLNSHQPHEDCSKFYLCPSETVESCPNGLEFNPVSQYCQEAHLAGCSNSTTPDISTTTTNTPPIFDSPCYGAPLNSHQPHEDCSKFYLCPSETVESCPNGLEFNPVSQYCQEAHLAGCSDITTPDISTTTTTTTTHPQYDVCYGEPYGKLVPDPEDCNQFYVCEVNPTLKQCPAGLHFNPNLQICDWPQSAGCIQK